MNAHVTEAIKPYVEFVQKQPAHTKPPVKKLSAPEMEIMKKAGLAIKNWQASPEGQAKMRAMPSMSLIEINSILSGLLQGPVFQEVRQLILDHPKLQSTLQSFPIHAISLAITFEAEIIVGVSGCIGYAVNPVDLTGVSASFLSVALDEGVDEGAFGGLQFGIWESSPDDMAGPAIGVDITLDLYAGLSIGVSRGTSADSWGATVTPVVGEDVGVELEESWTFLLTEMDLGLKPAYQFPARHMLILEWLVCEKTKDLGKDEVYLRFTIDDNHSYRFPAWDYRSMGTDDDTKSWYLGRSVWFDSKVEVVLYDTEDGGGDDVMKPSDKDHSFKFDYSDFSKDKTISRTMDYTSKLNEVKYKLSATLVK